MTSTTGSVGEPELAGDDEPAPEPAPTDEPTPAERRSDGYLIGF